MTALLTDAELAALRDIAVTLADDSPFNAERLLRLLDEHAALRGERERARAALARAARVEGVESLTHAETVEALADLVAMEAERNALRERHRRALALIEAWEKTGPNTLYTLLTVAKAPREP